MHSKNIGDCSKWAGKTGNMRAYLCFKIDNGDYCRNGKIGKGEDQEFMLVKTIEKPCSNNIAYDGDDIEWCSCFSI